MLAYQYIKLLKGEIQLETITIALPKGKLFAQSRELLEKAGYGAPGLSEDSRKLVIKNEAAGLSFVITKPMDLPTYVEYGAADIGIIGKDVLLEEQKDIYELLDLGFGKCRLMLAVPAGLRRSKLTDYANLRVATKYPRVAAEFFHGIGIQAEIIYLNGSIELAPMVGLSEMIVDIVETGRTLRENKLDEIAVIHAATARLIANRASFKLKFARIHSILGAMRRQLPSG
ncbi:MAG: ATP phosphoribosyltransferase [Acidaminococcales bacterium]|jgi:ATP phosphoribosyltransferase|nr:ATP phosphoribosyltransferase [Acidaminococcales bacterium]